MQDAGRMGVGQAGQGPGEHAQGLRHLEWPVVIDQLPQGGSGHVLRGHPGRAAVAPVAHHPDDVGVRDRLQRLHLGQEALKVAGRVGPRRIDELDGDVSFAERVVGQVDGARSSAAEDPCEGEPLESPRPSGFEVLAGLDRLGSRLAALAAEATGRGQWCPAGLAELHPRAARRPIRRHRSIVRAARVANHSAPERSTWRRGEENLTLRGGGLELGDHPAKLVVVGGILGR